MPNDKIHMRSDILVFRPWLRAFPLLALAMAAHLTAADTAAPVAPAVDPLFVDPYVDVNEWRDAPVRHRYVHGGFKGTETRFSYYFPPKAQYQGRFFQH